ncbi:MFS transporter [Paraburkholderia sediminicola]|uniref:MFS transporter n=1 Tax=Paraburkholderia sediminicola TaxID=458836 RepID=UPI0038BC011F
MTARSTALASAPTLEYGVEQALFARIAWRLMPFLFSCYLIAQIDRMNVSFAKLDMLQDLGFSETVYGLGAGIFFAGYVLFEVPSNMMLKRFGAHRWIGRIMISWGLLSAATLFVATPTQFYIMRFLLGVAEAGFFPGIIFYLTQWFTTRYRTRMTAIFMTAIAVAGLLVGPASGLILHSLPGWLGLHGWQWLFLIEGVPAVALGVASLFYLDATPQRAKWLSAEEKLALSEALAAEQTGATDSRLADVFRSPRVWLLSAIYGCYGMSFFGFVFWLPTIVKSAGVDNPLQIGLLTAIPWSIAVLAMMWIASYVDRHRNTRPVLIVLAVLAAFAWALSPLVLHNVVLSMLVLTLAMFGLMASLPVFWNLPTTLFRGSAAAAAIAMITSLGNLPGFFSPYIVGWIKQTTGSMNLAMVLFAAVTLLGAVLLAVLRDDPRESAQPQPPTGHA